jgi:hypothetical protein
MFTKFLNGVEFVKFFWEKRRIPLAKFPQTWYHIVEIIQ